QRNLSGIQVNRMGIELVNRDASLKVHVESNIKSIKCVEATFFTEEVAAEHVDDVSAIGVEWPDGKLVTEQIQVACGKVKQRAAAIVKVVIRLTKTAHNGRSAARRSVRNQACAVERRREDERYEVSESIQTSAGVTDGIHLINGEGVAIGPIARQGCLWRKNRH